MRNTAAMTWEPLCKLAATLPGVSVDWFRAPALEVRNEAFVRLGAQRRRRAHTGGVR